MVADVVAHNAEDTKLTGPVRSTSSGAGGTKAPRVPCPEGIKNWKQYYADNYPERAAKHISAYSAPAQLKMLKDEIYMAAAEAAGHPNGNS